MRSSDFQTDVCRTKKYGEQYLSQYLIGSEWRKIAKEKCLLEKTLGKRHKEI